MAPASVAATKREANSTPLEAVESHHEEANSALLEAAGSGDESEVVAALPSHDEEANSALLEAAESGDESEVVAALARPGVDVNCREDEGYRRTPLLLACNRPDGRITRSIVRVLLADSRVDVNARDIQGQTALHGFVDEMLLSCSTDIDWNAADKIGQTPLLWFARLGVREKLSLLITVESVDMWATTIDKFTALHQVAEGQTTFPEWTTPKDISERCVIVDLLLKELGRKGHNVVSFVNATDILNRSALHYIAEEGYIELLEVLCNHSPDMNVNGVDFHGFTPLHLAVRNGGDAVVKRLLQLQSIDANVRATVIASHPDTLKPFETNPQYLNLCRPNLLLKTTREQSSHDLTPLHFAAIDGRTEVVRLLLEREDIRIDAEDSASLTPLHYSVQHGHSEVVELLLTKGKPFATLNYDRQCGVFEDLLHLATMREEKAIAKTIAVHLLNTLGSRMNDFQNDISTKFSSNQSLSDQSRLLASAAVSNHFEIIKYIVMWQPEVNVNARSEWAAIPGLVATPLHFAAVERHVAMTEPKRGHVEAEEELLEHPKLDVNAQDNKKTTPLLYAIAAGNVDMVKA